MDIQEKITSFSPGFEGMPGVTVIHEIDGFKPIYMTSNGLALLGLTLEGLKAIGEDYQKLFFNRDFIEDYLQKLGEMIHGNDPSEIFTFFHQVKIEEEFQWYAASIKVFHTDMEHKPTHTVTYAVPLEDYSWTMKRAQRLLEETAFARENLDRFSSLSKREIEILTRAARGKRVAEISAEFKISTDTVNSHLKSIKNKLAATTSYELAEYAMAYDLI